MAPREGVDLAAEAAESEEYLKRWRAENPVKPSFWRRLLGLR
jgi:hypothetical protein